MTNVEEIAKWIQRKQQEEVTKIRNNLWYRKEIYSREYQQISVGHLKRLIKSRSHHWDWGRTGTS